MDQLLCHYTFLLIRPTFSVADSNNFASTATLFIHSVAKYFCRTWLSHVCATEPL